MTWEGGAGIHLVADADTSLHRGRLDGEEAFYSLGY